MKNTIWKTVKAFTKQAFAPVGDEAKSPDHKARWVLRDGVPDLCCEQHRFHVRRSNSRLRERELS